MNIKQAKEIIVSLGKTSKMPCPTYSTPAKLCVTGSKLRKIKGSTCHKCYAMRGNYLYPSVGHGLEKRFNAFKNPRFVEAMTLIIKAKCTSHFRWFDSGDLADTDMLEKIIEVCQNTPKIKHWLPTREAKIIDDYLRIHKEFPKNLIVRVSAAMIDGKPSKSFRWTSSVHYKEKPIGYDCPSRFQQNKCVDCRTCWDKRVKNVSYHKH